MAYQNNSRGAVGADKQLHAARWSTALHHDFNDAAVGRELSVQPDAGARGHITWASDGAVDLHTSASGGSVTLVPRTPPVSAVRMIRTSICLQFAATKSATSIQMCGIGTRRNGIFLAATGKDKKATLEVWVYRDGTKRVLEVKSQRSVLDKTLEVAMERPTWFVLSVVRPTHVCVLVPDLKAPAKLQPRFVCAAMLEGVVDLPPLGGQMPPMVTVAEPSVTAPDTALRLFSWTIDVDGGGAGVDSNIGLPLSLVAKLQVSDTRRAMLVVANRLPKMGHNTGWGARAHDSHRNVQLMQLWATPRAPYSVVVLELWRNVPVVMTAADGSPRASMGAEWLRQEPDSILAFVRAPHTKGGSVPLGSVATTVAGTPTSAGSFVLNTSDGVVLPPGTHSEPARVVVYSGGKDTDAFEVGTLRLAERSGDGSKTRVVVNNLTRTPSQGDRVVVEHGSSHCATTMVCGTGSPLCMDLNRPCFSLRPDETMAVVAYTMNGGTDLMLALNWEEGSS